MIVALIAIALAFVWLLKETDCLRVRLLVGKVVIADRDKVKPASIPQVNFKPSIFERLEMPATTGNINIICMRE